MVGFDSIIQPGRVGTITPKIELKNLHGGAFMKSVTVTSNAKNTPSLRLSLGVENDESDVDYVLQTLPPIVERLDKALRDALDHELLIDPYELDLPQWEKTPGEVNIPVILWLRNLVRAYDMKKYAQMRYNLLGNGGHWFPGRNAERAGELPLAQACAHSPLAPHITQWLAEAHQMLGQDAVKRLSQSDS